MLAYLLSSCSSQTETQVVESVLSEENMMRHAHNVRVSETSYGYLLEVRNPWDTTKMLGRYALSGDTLSQSVLPSDVVPVVTPVQSVVAFSATQWSVFKRLGEIGRVKGILEGYYVGDTVIRNLMASGEILDLGPEADADLERMIRLQPDIILYSPYFENNQESLKITGAVLFPFADYLENTPLGRAEWLRVIGFLAGMPEKADAWFDEIESKYTALKSLCDGAESRPTVFSDKAFNGQWYVAGGNSYIARLFADAGADYIWKDNGSPASFPLDSETILSKAQHADYWRIANAGFESMNYDDLERENPIYPLFDAFKNRKVLVCDTQKVGYFEQAQCEPDILLADFIYFFHPECLVGAWKDYSPKYYHWLGVE